MDKDYRTITVEQFNFYCSGISASASTAISLLSFHILVLQFLTLFRGVFFRLANATESFAVCHPCQIMDPHDSASVDAQNIIEAGNSAPSLTTGLDPALMITPGTEGPAVHQVGPFLFNEYQLDYVLFNLVYAKGFNTPGQMVLVMRYKWPEQFPLILKSHLLMVIQWFCPTPQASQ